MKKNLFGRVSRLLRRLSITKRFVIIFLFISVVPLMIMGNYTAAFYQRSIYDKLIQSSYQTLRSLNTTISMENKKYLDYTYQVR